MAAKVYQIRESGTAAAVMNVLAHTGLVFTEATGGRLMVMQQLWAASLDKVLAKEKVKESNGA